MNEPVFILCHPKSGSTLLRLILNAHPALCCPPESHLLVLGVALKQTLSVTEKNAFPNHTLDNFNREIEDRIRNTLSGIMQDHAERNGKQVWCEKSVTTTGDLPYLTRLYPNAKYIVLYRHCMDFIHSAVEVSRFGWKEIGVEIKDPEKIVDSIADFWLEQTNMLQDFAQENPTNTLEVKYESLLTDSTQELERLFDFLGFSITDNFLETVFTTQHQHGTGDPKARFFKKLETSNLGKGRFIPVEKLSKLMRRNMNRTLTELDYETVGSDWNEHPLPEYCRIDGPTSENATVIVRELDTLFESYLPSAMAAFVQAETVEPRRIKLVVSDCSDRAYLLNFADGTCLKAQPQEQADCTLSFRFGTLKEIIAGKSNPGQAVSLGKIILNGDADSASLVPRIFEYIQ